MKKSLVFINIVIGICVGGTLVAATTSTTTSSSGSHFTPAQKKQIGEICGNYIIKNPTILIKASQELQRLQQQKEQAQHKKAMQVVIKKADQLTHDPMSPSIGNPKAKVTLVEFYDSNCRICHLAYPIIKKFLVEHKDVRYVIKQFPIFEQQWVSSKVAAEGALIAYKKGGATELKKFLDGIFNAKKHLEEGNLKVTNVDQIAEASGFDIQHVSKKLLKIENEQIQKDQQLAEDIGFQGTPAIIVMPTFAKPTPKNVTIFFGFAPPKALKEAVEKTEKNS